MAQEQNVKLPKLSAEELQDLSLLWNRYRQDSGYSRPHFDRAKNGVLSYKIYRDPNSHPYKYNPAVPLVFTITESMASAGVNAIFTRPTLADVMPVERTHLTAGNIPDDSIATQATKVLNLLVLNPDRELHINIEELLKETCLLGNGATINLPVFDHKRESDIGGPVYLGPSLKHKSYFDIIPDREGCRFSDCRWIWDLERVPIEELKNRIGKGGYKNLNEATLKALSDDRTWVPEGVDWFDNIQSTTGNQTRRDPGGFDKKSGIVLLLHFYDTFTGHYKTMAANRLLIRDTSTPREITLEGGGKKTQSPPPPYPYNPYGDIRLWSYPGEFYSYGIAKVAGVYQDEINLWKSMRYENIEMVLHKVLMYNPVMGVKEEDIWMAPAALIKTHDVHNSIKELELDDITNSSYVEQAQAEKNAYDASGDQPEGRGNLPHRREAATTVLAIQQEGQKRMQAFMKTRVGPYLRKELKKVLMQMRTFMSKSEYERILGEQDAGFYNLNLLDIEHGFDIVPSIPAIDGIRETELQNLSSILQVASAIPGAANVVNWDTTFKTMFRLIMPGENPDQFILTPEAQQKKMMEMQAQQGQVPGQAPPGQTPKPPGSRPTGQPTISPSAIMRESAAGRLGGQQGAR